MSLESQIKSTTEGERAWHQEQAIFETTELICEIMDREGVSRSQLAKRIGTTKGYITQLLDGATNMTIRTVSDVFLALGHEFHPSATALGRKSTPFVELGVHQLKWGTEATAITSVATYFGADGPVLVNSLTTPAA